MKPTPVVKKRMELGRIDIEHLTLDEQIGQSKHGSVWKGVYATEEGIKKKKIKVLVKRFHTTAENNLNNFIKKADTIQQLSHKCIVQVFGIVNSDNKELLLVERFIKMGSMLDFLLDRTTQVEQEDLYLWAGQIANGMLYLEEKKVIHKDLAARNIILESTTRAKITFGWSHALGPYSDFDMATARKRWPFKWYAPECMNYDNFSHASDVWSFGVTLWGMWEMFSYNKSTYGEQKHIDMITVMKEGNQLAQPKACPVVLYTKMKHCWSKKAIDRPNFKHLNEYFASFPINATA